MASPKDVTVSLIPVGPNEVKVWNASFTLDCTPPKTEDERKALQKRIERALRNLNIEVT